MKAVIRQGDALREYGGCVLGGHYDCFGKGIACKGDAVKCNKHGMTTIAEGSTLTDIGGKPVAMHGHRCACGCTLVSSFPDCEIAQ
ncbi:TPA: PAAR domain-containing protein [Salmonella enterica]|nr:PAAR domain-containing protein [Salmonella enterica]MCH5735981.1 PAAR domain-containing protein [Salmonella enterica]MCH5741752.1 PAAR domain-containing protein [Salmonella enterica]MCH5745704.1 PAAR domain-containing protein [Salmonella enterica]MCH5755332.1 PAAR domain-containing protein [Salmonella enterica]